MGGKEIRDLCIMRWSGEFLVPLSDWSGVRFSDGRCPDISHVRSVFDANSISYTK